MRRSVLGRTWLVERGGVMRQAGAVAVAICALLLAGCAPLPGAPASSRQVSNGAWEVVPESPLSPRQGMVAEWVDGRFVLIGGSSEPSCPPSASCVASEVPRLRDGAVLDLESNRWRAIADAPIPLSSSRTAAVGDSLYLVAVPDQAVQREVFLRYDLDADEWTRLPDAPRSTGDLVAAGDRVLAIADTDERGPTRDAVFSPATGRWTDLPDDPLGPSFNRSAAWLGDQLLLTAKRLVKNPGADGPSLTRMATLSADLTTWTALPDSSIIGGNPIAVAGLVVFPGLGEADGGGVGNWGRSYPEGGIWNPKDGSWTRLPDGAPSLVDAGGTDLPGLGLGGEGTVLIGGALLDPVARSWLQLPDPGLSKRYSQAVVVGDDSVLLWGGTADGWERNLSDGALLRY